MMPIGPHVSKVTVLEGYRLKLLFDNGEQGIYDCSHLLDFGVFQEFRDKVYFGRARVSHGTVVWPHEQDICPDTLYLDSDRTQSDRNDLGGKL